MTALNFVEQSLPGIFLVKYFNHFDDRGSFSKPFHLDSFLSCGISFTPAESFLTSSHKYVLRGMHYQSGVAAHNKLVFCPRGRVLDVVVDIRPDSPNFNKPFSIELSPTNSTALFISKGYAHGFISLDDDSWMFYLTDTVHCPALDQGILWSSLDFEWPILNPRVSQRDSLHPPIGYLL